MSKSDVKKVTAQGDKWPGSGWGGIHTWSLLSYLQLERLPLGMCLLASLDTLQAGASHSKDHKLGSLAPASALGQGRREVGDLPRWPETLAGTQL